MQDLREATVNFVQTARERRDQAALVWVLQRTVYALTDLVSPDTILRRVIEILPRPEDDQWHTGAEGTE